MQWRNRANHNRKRGNFPEASTEAGTESSASSDADGGAAKGDGNYTIAVVPKDSTNPWFVRMEEGVAKYQEENPGMTVFQKGPVETDAASRFRL